MNEIRIQATPMGFAGEARPVMVEKTEVLAGTEVPEAAQAEAEMTAKTAPKLVEFPGIHEAEERFEEVAEADLFSDEWLELQLNLHIREAEYEAERAKAAKLALPKLRRKAKHFRDAVLSYFIGWGVVGFVLGVVLAVSQLLERHGPTVTIHGTIGAGMIYIFSGLFFGVFFGLSGRRHAIDRADDFAAQAKEQKKIIEEAEVMRVSHIEQAEACDAELRKRRFAWLFDEF